MTSRCDNLKLIISELLKDFPQYANLQLPTALSELQNLMRALQNMRPPLPVSPDFITIQDLELQQQLADKGIISISDISEIVPNIFLWQGDITRLKVDAIVNAANNALLGCFSPLHKCIDNAIHSAAGIQLRLECNQIMKMQGHPEPTGSAKITDGYNLPAKHVIHTVGPIISNGRPTPYQEQELANCYLECLKLADSNKLSNIAFCCISTGVFGFPQHRAAEIAVATTTDYLKNAAQHIKQVIFNVFKDDDLSIYQQILSKNAK